MTHPKLIETLTQPKFYPHATEEKIVLIQTHISYILIAGDFVYKVKKPVDFGFLDFTSLDKRKYYCEEELRLNRRLAPNLYLEVVEIFDDGRGNVVLKSGKNVIEYAVKMKKIPQDGMLKEWFLRGKVDHSLMQSIALKLAGFHKRAATGGKIDQTGGVETIRRNHDENFDQTEPYLNITIPVYQYRFIKAYIHDFMKHHEWLLFSRVKEHRIRDCHGDLHMEHICIVRDENPTGGYVNPESIIIFDCIEFNERFRYMDVAAEVAFLAMDLDYNGYCDYADSFVDAYVKHAEDPEIKALLNFYRCYYAYVRGKVIGFRLQDKDIPQNERNKAREEASKYFNLAFNYAARPEKPTLILMSGLMGTGKSVLAKHLAPRLGAMTIQTDVVRKELLNIAAGEHHYEEFGKGIYSSAITQKTYEKALETALEKLKGGKSVIIDASYRNREERLKALEAAKKVGADFFILECTCREDSIKKRLHMRMSDPAEPSDGRWEIFQTQKINFDPITEIPGRYHIVLDTSLPLEDCTLKTIEEIKYFI